MGGIWESEVRSRGMGERGRGRARRRGGEVKLKGQGCKRAGTDDKLIIQIQERVKHRKGYCKRVEDERGGGEG